MMVTLTWKAIALTAAAAMFCGGMAIGGGAAGNRSVVRYTAKGEMIFPSDYRSWVYLTSGHGMSYDPRANAAEDAPFDNIFVDPAAHAAFLKTGHWPEGAALLIENRAGSTKGSINLHGAFQSGEPQVIEVHVKDSKRFKGGWGFFAFRGTPTATLIDYKANCYSCHSEHAAVDTTFVQFYPTLLPVAAAKRTFSAAYVAEEKARR